MNSRLFIKQWAYLLTFVLCLGQPYPVSAASKEGAKVPINKELEGNISAPEFPNHLEWLNTGRPLNLADLRGKVVLLDFWTFCCINCMHVLPDLARLEEKYAEELVVIGVHSAKFSNEQQTEAIRNAILRYEIKHPVLNDKDMEVWQSYGTRAWPTFVLINPHGKIIGTHSGEGIFELFDQAIAQTISYFDAKGDLRRSKMDFTLEADKRSSSLLSFPGKVSSDTSGNQLAITDSNHHRILITDPNGTILEMIGTGQSGLRDGSFEETLFNHPQGTAFDGNVLYIADTENHTIRKADLDKRTVTTVLGRGTQARQYNIAGKGTDVALNSPWALQPHGEHLYIAMAGSHQLWVANLKTWETRPYAGSGREARIDGHLLQAALAQPSGLTTDGEKLYFADSEVSSIRSADLKPQGQVETLVGEGLFEFGDQDGPWHQARLQHALGVAYHNQKLYVADTYNSKIKEIDLIEKNIKTVSGSGQAGYLDAEIQQALYNEPAGLAILNGKIYIADTNNHAIRVLNIETNTVHTLDLKNKEMIAQRKMKRDFQGRTVEIERQNVAAGEVEMNIHFQLPPQFKWTEGAPFYAEWHSENAGIVSIQKQPADFDFTHGLSTLKLPLFAHQGKTDLRVNAVLYYCRENETRCFFDSVKIHIPVQIAAGDAPSSDITVDVKTEGA